MEFSAEVSFARDGYVLRQPVMLPAGELAIDISCYSLDDEAREEFARVIGSDPVADLSCYVKEIDRENEYTMLGLNGEPLQFTPGFFWFSDVIKCEGNKFRLDASLRGVVIQFEFSDIDRDAKSARLDARVDQSPTAINEWLDDRSYQTRCV